MNAWGDLIDENDAIHAVYKQLQQQDEVTPEALATSAHISVERAQGFIENEQRWDSPAPGFNWK